MQHPFWRRAHPPLYSINCHTVFMFAKTQGWIYFLQSRFLRTGFWGVIFGLQQRTTRDNCVFERNFSVTWTCLRAEFDSSSWGTVHKLTEKEEECRDPLRRCWPCPGFFFFSWWISEWLKVNLKVYYWPVNLALLSAKVLWTPAGYNRSVVDWKNHQRKILTSFHWAI